MNHQKGIATVEFAIVASIFMLILMSIIEFGIILLTWNSLSEATRRGARVAVVCPVNDPAIRNIAIFDDALGSRGSAISGLTSADISVEYLDSEGSIILDTTSDYLGITFVRVFINSSYNFAVVLPWLKELANAPAFLTTLPRESLGISRENVHSCSV